MGVMECASAASIWRGYEYYKEEKVRNLKEIADDVFSAEVSGGADKPYNVILNVAHARKSSCDCPHAGKGSNIVCKHMVATFFAVFPDSAESFYHDVVEEREETEREAEELYEKVVDYVRHMRKEQLVNELLGMLFDGPEWQLDRFAYENGLKEYR